MYCSDVFISYRRKEADGSDPGTQIARALFRYLESKGLRVFLDEERMDNGPFPEQLRWQVTHAPNYIFIATEAAMKFRDVTPPDTDYVSEEVRLALKLYKETPKDRVILPVIPHNISVPSDSDDRYPEEIHQLFRHNAPKQLSGALPDEKSLKDIHARITKVSRGNLWNAGSRWLEEATKPGGRFANLSVDRTIMPLAGADQKKGVFLPVRAHLKNQQDAPLMDMITNTKGHLYLIGEGGIGKTTALFSIMKKVYGPGRDEADIDRYRQNGQVPLFVELSKVPDTYGRLYEGGRSTFIQRAVYQQLRRDLKVKQVSGAAVQEIQEVFNLDPDTAVRPIHDIFTEESPAPEYLLLLDGLNEVPRTEIGYTVKDGDGTERTGRSTVVSMVLQEIKQLMNECPNVRVILTSRSEEQTNWSDKTTLLYLSGVKDETMESYLRGRGVPEVRITAALQNEKLKDLLRIPLFLTLYASLEGNDRILTRGEILHLFFRQKKEKLYTVKARNESVDRDVDEAASARQPGRLTPDMQSFILDFILPEIAWRMEQDGLFYLRRRGKGSREGLRRIIWRVLTDQSGTAVCGENGMDAFGDYRQYAAKNNTRKTATEIRRRLGGGNEENQEEIAEGVLDCAVMVLGILQKSESNEGQEEYGFIHHHIRDYFAAEHQINRLTLAVFLQENDENGLARECMTDWAEHPFHSEVQRFIGEALGESHNAPVCDENGSWHYAVPREPCSRNLIKRGFDIYRGSAGGHDGYAVWNQLEILKEVRRDLSGESFAGLDLRGCELNGTCLSRQGNIARFDHALVSAEVFLPHGHVRAVNSAFFSSDGKQLISASDDQNAIIWDADTGQEVRRLSCPGTRILYSCFSKDGSYAVTAGDDCAAVVWDLSANCRRHVLKGHTGWITCVCISPDDRYIVTASRDSTARVWSAETGNQTAVLQGHTAAVSSAAFDPDGDRLATSSWDGSVRIWNTTDWSEAASFTAHHHKVSSVSFSPDGSMIATASWDRKAALWDAADGHCLAVFSGHEGIVQSAAFDNTGHRILTASEDHTIRQWDTLSLTEISKLTRARGWPLHAVYSPDGHTMAVAFTDRLAALWDADTLTEKKMCSGYTTVITDISFSGDGGYFLISCADGEARLWDADRLVCVGTLKVNQRRAYSAAFSPDGRRALTASFDAAVTEWDLASFKPVRRLEGPEDTVSCAEYNRDGTRIAAASSDGNVFLWDAQTGALLRKINTQQGWVYTAKFSPCGKYIVTASEDRTVRILNAENGREIKRMEGHGRTVRWACFSPDGKTIASASWDRTVRIWDCDAGSELHVLTGHRAEVAHASFSHDGRFLVTSSDDRTVRVWDTKLYQPVATLDGHEMPVQAAAFSPDGQRIFTVSQDGTIRVWDALNFACTAILPNVPGLEMWRCDLRKAKKEPDFPEETCQVFRRYEVLI